MAKMPIMDRSISGVTKGREAMLNLKHLDYFYEVARCGSITKAAQNLYMTQPALSKAIHQLEDDLNCKLLNRTIKGVSLTSQGEILLDAVITSMRLLERAREKIAELNDEMSSCVRLGAGGDTVNCILLSLLNTFAHENANVTVQIKEYSTSRGIKALLNNDVDIVFIPRNSPHCGQKWTAGRRKASGLSPASPLTASPSAEPRLQASFFCVCHFRNAPVQRRNVRFCGFRRVRARLCRKSRTNRRHGRDGL